MEAQTFIIDPAVVQYADQISITSVDLFFKQKPFGVGADSGALDPGVTVYITPTAAGGAPNYGILDDFTSARKEFSEIVSSIDASVSTKFSFTVPIVIKTGIEYAVVIKPDLEESYVLWAATQGEINVESDTYSPGVAGKYWGRYFELTNVSGTWQTLPYKDLKFQVNVARYAYDGVIPEDYQPEFELYMKNYEFVTHNISASTGSFYGGEYVYQEKSVPDGTCDVVQGETIATTTSSGFAGLFSVAEDNAYIVVESTDRRDVRKVINVSNTDNTVTVDRPFTFSNAAANFISTPVARAYISNNGRLVSNSDNFLVLADSTANSTLRFTNNSILIGENSGTTIANAYFNDILVHSTEPHVYVHVPPKTSINSNQIFTYTSTDNLNGSLSAGEMNVPIKMYEAQNLEFGQPIMLMSRSNEVALRSWDSTQKSLSSRLNFRITASNDYSSPVIDYNATDVFFTRYIINNDSTNEHTKFGNAYSKHITKKISFAEGRQAEDVLVYLQAYKPAYTDIKVYAKLYNSEDSDYYDDKDWSLLTETSGARNSDIARLNDLIEYTYELPDTPTTASTLAGVINIVGDSDQITGTGTDFSSNLQAGDLIKIYSTLFPEEKYIVASVYSVESATGLTLSAPLPQADVSAIGTFGLKIDKLLYKHQAFKNKRNSNTARYYNSSMTIFDKYDSFSVKIVLLSENQFIIPRVSNIRAIGVSA